MCIYCQDPDDEYASETEDSSTSESDRGRLVRLLASFK